MVPFEFRQRLAYDGKLPNVVGRIFLDSVLGFYRRRMRSCPGRGGNMLNLSLPIRLMLMALHPAPAVELFAVERERPRLAHDEVDPPAGGEVDEVEHPFRAVGLSGGVYVPRVT